MKCLIFVGFFLPFYIAKNYAFEIDLCMFLKILHHKIFEFFRIKGEVFVVSDLLSINPRKQGGQNIIFCVIFVHKIDV